MRRQDQFLESLYTQHIHEGGAESFEEFINKFDHKSFNWKLLLKGYSELFGKDNIKVHRYHEDFLKENIIISFGQTINSKFLLKYSAPSVHNAGYNRDALEVARLTNPFLNKAEKVRLRNILQETNSKKPLSSYSYFTPEERKDFIKGYHSSNKSVAKEYFGSQPPQLFPLEEAKSELYQGLSIEGLAIVLTKALLLGKEEEVYIKEDISRIERIVLRWLSKYSSLKKTVKHIISKLNQYK